MGREAERRRGRGRIGREAERARDVDTLYCYCSYSSI